MVRRTCFHEQIESEELTPDQTRRAVARLCRVAQIFLASDDAQRMTAELQELADEAGSRSMAHERPSRYVALDTSRAPSEPPRRRPSARRVPIPRDSIRITVRRETDVSVARSQTREFCRRAEARPAIVQRCATIVSELSRNITSYTPGGEILLRFVGDGAPPRLRIVAADTGSGIPQLHEIEQGTYRSRTGLGMGIRGCARLADSFHIDTATTGTTVVAEVDL